MHNIFVINFVFLIALLHVSMFRHNPQGVIMYAKATNS